MKKLLLIPLALILISALVFAGCPTPPATTTPPPPPPTGPTTPPPPPPPQTLKIGAILQVSGWYSAVDASDSVNTQIVADLINSKGGLTIQGQQYNIEVVIEDGKSTLDGNTTAANKLILDHKVDFSVGPSGPFPVAVSGLFNAAEVMLVIGFNTFEPGSMDATTPYTFLGYTDPLGEFSAVEIAMQNEFPDVQHIVFLSGDEPATDAIAPKVKARLEEHGFTVADEVVKFSLEAEDYSPIAAKINAIDEADAFFMLLGTPPSEAAILKGLRALGNDTPYCLPIFAPDLLAIAGADACYNVVCALSYTPNAPWNPPGIDEVHNMGPADLTWFGMTPNALWVLCQVIQAADSIDPEVVMAKWESMDTVDTLYGEGTFCGDETYGLTHHSLTFALPFAKIQDGEIIDLGWITPLPTP